MSNDGWICIFFFGGLFFNLWIGGAIGATKGRMGLGVALAFLLGPIGWIITGCMSDGRRFCPFCHSQLVTTEATVCASCGREVGYHPPKKSLMEMDLSEVVAKFRKKPLDNIQPSRNPALRNSRTQPLPSPPPAGTNPQQRPNVTTNEKDPLDFLR